MNIIRLSVKSSREEVRNFLDNLMKILQDENFDIDKDLVLIKSKKKKDKEQYSTPYTLLTLEYDNLDVVKRLKELTIEEYSETIVDKDDVSPPLLFIFGKNINDKQVFIKLKIKGEQQRHVLCVSFHYAEHVMTFPYA